MNKLENKILKHFLKGKKKVTEALVVTFMITGGLIGQETEAGINLCTKGSTLITCGLGAGAQTNANRDVALGFRGYASNYGGRDVHIANEGLLRNHGATAMGAQFTQVGKAPGSILLENRASGRIITYGTRGASGQQVTLIGSTSTFADIDIINNGTIEIRNGQQYSPGILAENRTGAGYGTGKSDIDITNTGSITNNGSNGVNKGSKSGIQVRTFGSGSTIDISNSGSISANNNFTAFGDGINIIAQNSNFNVNNTGSIVSGNGGVTIDGNFGFVNSIANVSSGTVKNTNSIRGRVGIDLKGVKNTSVQNTGTVSGSQIGLSLVSSTGNINIANTGTITGATGVAMAGSGATVNFNSTGTVSSMSSGMSSGTSGSGKTTINLDVLGKGIGNRSFLSLTDGAVDLTIKESLAGNVLFKGGNDVLTFEDNNATKITINGKTVTGSAQVTAINASYLDGGSGTDKLVFDGFAGNVSGIDIRNFETIEVKGTRSSGIDFGSKIETNNLLVSSGGKLDVNGTQTIVKPSNNNQRGNLTLSGGEIVISKGGLLNANQITLTGGTTSTITVEGVDFGSGGIPTGNVLDLDDVSSSRVKVIDGNSITGTGTIAGGTSGSSTFVDRGPGRYYFGTSGIVVDKSSGDVFAAQGGLSKVRIFIGNTLNLDSNGANDVYLNAQLTGGGAIKSSGDVRLNNGSNDFKGKITVSNGFLSSFESGSFGQTSELNVASGTVYLNGNYEKVGSLTGSGRVNMGNQAGRGLAISGNKTGTFSGSLQGGASVAILNGAKATFSGNNTFSGGLTIGSGASLTATSATALGKSSVTQLGTLTLSSSGTSLRTFGNAITGNGSMVIAGNGQVGLIGNNSAFTGSWNINSGATLNVNSRNDLGNSGSGTALGLNNKITGSGTLNVDLSGVKTLGIGSGAGTNFNGALLVKNGTLNLNSTASSFLRGGATLNVSNNAIADIDGSKTIGNLTLSGGEIKLDENAKLTTGVIYLQNGTSSNINVAGLDSGSVGVFDPSKILELDDVASNSRVVIDGTAIVGSGSLTSNTGGSTSNNITGSNAIYSFGGATGLSVDKANGDILVSESGLTRIFTLSGKTVLLNTAGLSGDYFDQSAQITGAGNIAINSPSVGSNPPESRTIVLNNAGNNFTGTTTVIQGAVEIGANNALGRTSALIFTSGGNGMAARNHDVSVGALIGSGIVLLDNGTLTITGTQGDIEGTFNGFMTGTGSLAVVAGEVATLDAVNNLTGGTTITGATINMLNASTLGSGAVVNNGRLQMNFDGDFKNSMSGAGVAGISAGKTVSLSGNNTNFSGTWDIAGSLNVDGKNELGFGSNVAGRVDINNAIIGSGNLNVNLGVDDDIFFGAGTGTGFTGLVNIVEGDVRINDSASNFLGATSLRLNQGGSATVVGSQMIGDLTLSGAGINLDQDSKLTAGTIHLVDGTVSNINIAGLGSGSTGGFDPNRILELDDVSSNSRVVIDGTSITGTGTLTSNAGSTGGGVVDEVNATYTFSGATGLSVDRVNGDVSVSESGLTKIDIKAGKTVLLSTAGLSGNYFDLSAQLTGTGNINVSTPGVGQVPREVVLNNTGNDFTGTTTITQGGIEIGADNALGKTSALYFANAGTTLGVGGYDVSVGALSGNGTVSLNDGTLTITGAQGNIAGTFNGSITGNGRLSVTNGEVATFNAQSSLTGGTTIAGARINMLNDSTLGSGNIVNNGRLQMNFDGDLKNSMSGAGVAGVSAGNTVSLSGNNRNFTGTWDIAGSLNVDGKNDLGFGSNIAGRVDIKNAITGSGNMNINMDINDNIFFGAGTGTGFTGLVNIVEGNVRINDDASNFLTGARLRLNTGGSATVIGNKEIGDLVSNGGEIALVGDSTLKAKDITLIGTTEIIVDDNRFTTDGNILDLDTGGQKVVLIDGESIVGAGGVTLTNGAPNVVNNTVGTYTFSTGGVGVDRVNGDIYGSTGNLVSVDVNKGQTLLINKNGATDSDLSSLITGEGSIRTQGIVSVSNGNNSFSGNVVVGPGRLQTLATGALGETALVNVIEGGLLSLVDNDQTIGGLVGIGRVNLGAAKLTIDGNQANPANGVNSFDGSIEGSGSLEIINGGVTRLGGSNGFTGGTTISSGSTVNLRNEKGFGEGAVLNNGTINVRTDGSLLNDLSGNGMVDIRNASIYFKGANNNLSGDINIAASGLLSANTGNNLGSADVAINGGLTVRGDRVFVLDNNLSGAGNINVVSGQRFSFGTQGTSQVSSFTGNVNMLNGSIALGGNAANNDKVLSNANLRLAGTGVAVVTDTTSIGNLTLSGGALALEGTSNLAVDNLYVTSTSTIKIDENRFTGGNSLSGSKSFLDLDTDGVDKLFVTSSGKSTATGSNVKVTDMQGNSLGNQAISNIYQGASSPVGKAYLGINGVVIEDSVTGEKGIGLGYGLTKVSINDGKTLTLDNRYNSIDNTFSAQITGAGSLEIAAQGVKDNTITLMDTTNNFTGQTRVTSGTLKIGQEGVISGSSGVVIASGAKVDLNNNNLSVKQLTGTGEVSLGTGDLTINGLVNSTFGGNISGAGRLVKAGNSEVTLTSDSSLTGNTVIAGGTMKLASLTGNTLANTGTTLVRDGGTLELANNQTVRNLSGSGSVAIGGNTLTLNNSTSSTATGDTNFSGMVIGSGDVIKEGNQKLIVSGNLTGANGSRLIINAGEVELQSALAAGIRDIANGSTLSVSFANGRLENDISGTGTTLITGSNIDVAGDNRLFTGDWQVEGSMSIANAANLGNGNVVFSNGLSELEISGGSTTLSNQFAGPGIINVNIGENNEFVLRNNGNLNSDFGGELKLTKGRITVDDNISSTLRTGTLTAGSQGTVIVNSNQEMFGLKLDGGALRFDNNGNTFNGTLKVDVLVNVGGGTLEIDPVDLDLDTTAQTNLPILDSDNGVNIRLVEANKVGGEFEQLTVVQTGTGTDLSQKDTIENALGETVADTTFDFSGVINSRGIGVGFNLVEINVRNGKTLEINDREALDDVLSARLTGTGNVIVSAEDRIVLVNRNNDFTGNLTVASGLVVAPLDNTLGNVRNIDIATGATLNTASSTQKALIETLNIASQGQLVLRGGTLDVKSITASDASRIRFSAVDPDGTFTGPGTINIHQDSSIGSGVMLGEGYLNILDGVTTTISGSNFGGKIDVDVAGTSTLNVGATLGGGVTNNGTMNIIENPLTSAISINQNIIGGDINNNGAINMSQGERTNDIFTVNGDFVSQPGSLIVMDINASTSPSKRSSDRIIVGGTFSGESTIQLNSLTDQIYNAPLNNIEKVQALATNFEIISAGSMTADLSISSEQQFNMNAKLARLSGSPFVWKLTTDSNSANLSVATNGELGQPGEPDDPTDTRPNKLEGGQATTLIGTLAPVSAEESLVVGEEDATTVESVEVVQSEAPVLTVEDIMNSPSLLSQVIIGPEVAALSALNNSSNVMINDSVRGLHSRLGELRNNRTTDSGNEFLLNEANSPWAAWSKGTTSGVDENGSYDGSFGGVDLGVDYLWSDVATDLDVMTGAFVGYRHGSFESDGEASNGVKGSYDTTSLTTGVYTTFFYDNSWYTDLVFQYGKLTTDIDGKSVSTRTDMHGDAYTGSIETGYSFNVTDKWIVEPQAQFTATFIDTADVRINDIEAKFDTEEYLTGRVGVRTEYQFDFANNVAFKPYVKASGLYEFADRESVEYGGFEVEGNEFSDGFETGIGATVTVADHFGIYGEFDYTTDFDEFDQYRGSFGVRYSF